jgi:hypothetical protein
VDSINRHSCYNHHSHPEQLRTAPTGTWHGGNNDAPVQGTKEKIMAKHIWNGFGSLYGKISPNPSFITGANIRLANQFTTALTLHMAAFAI